MKKYLLILAAIVIWFLFYDTISILVDINTVVARSVGALWGMYTSMCALKPDFKKEHLIFATVVLLFFFAAYCAYELLTILP